MMVLVIIHLSNFELLSHHLRSIYVLCNHYRHGQLGLQQDRAKGVKLLKQATALGSSKAHFQLGTQYDAEGDSKKSKFNYEAAAMAGNEVARLKLGMMEAQSGNKERGVKHWMIAASAGDYLFYASFENKV